MHKIILGILFLSSTIFSLDWVKDIDTALAVAQKENKNVMVFVESPYCKWCKKMKDHTFSDESVEKRLEKYVVVTVMKNDSKAMVNLPHVKGVPATFFMNANKKVIESAIGYLTVEEFILYINDVEKKKGYL